MLREPAPRSSPAGPDKRGQPSGEHASGSATVETEGVLGTKNKPRQGKEHAPVGSLRAGATFERHAKRELCLGHQARRFETGPAAGGCCRTALRRQRPRHAVEERTTPEWPGFGLGFGRGFWRSGANRDFGRFSTLLPQYDTGIKYHNRLAGVLIPGTPIAFSEYGPRVHWAVKS